ncbi:hypothetical protein KC19_8G183500 [Ceratodon purpureus]|uniref:beta-carotene 3-hydroxylase n=1 Tax=Ceratodon purpureus TaxID=3225 RepID=A0A8T0H1X7_CERPU|nr:hypothetical protein KC19_8G183500 [Ceratodon purpureus]
MAECVANLQCVASRSIQTCFSVAHSCTLRNAPGVLVYNPLGCSPRNGRLLAARISVRPSDAVSGRRIGGPVCVISNDSSQEPIQRSVETEAECDNGGAKNIIDFASSLVSAVGSDGASEIERPEKKRRNRKGERKVYMMAAIASSIGFTALSAGAVYYRFHYQTQGLSVNYLEIFGTFSLAIGAAVGMEYWARWAHKALWHDSLWNMHESHHKPREGPFEMNDVFAIINAVPAIALMAYGFFHSGLVPGLCFGAGLGITMFGMAYMFVHDGLVHRRFPVGPIADVPYLQKVAAAHQLHHADLFGGVPYGLFLGPQELKNVGGEEELQKVLNAKYKSRKE